jgi:hypothetical protein
MIVVLAPSGFTNLTIVKELKNFIGCAGHVPHAKNCVRQTGLIFAQKSARRGWLTALAKLLVARAGQQLSLRSTRAQDDHIANSGRAHLCAVSWALNLVVVKAMRPHRSMT